jgi:Flp pilus assembly protein TadD
MSHQAIIRRPAISRATSFTAAFAAALLLGACANQAFDLGAIVPASGPADSAAETPTKSAAQRQAAQKIQQIGDLSALTAQHNANPTDPAGAIALAHGLRLSGKKSEAVAVLEKASSAKPGDKALAKARGLMELELGRPAKAEPLLKAALDAKAPDWRVLSGLGTVLASQGKQQEAQIQFAKALALAPDHPSVLNNLALSYALDGKPAEAEKLLRKAKAVASADGKVPQNLALVLGLSGKHEEAKSLTRTALSPSKADNNVLYLQQLAGLAPAGDQKVTSKAERSAALPPPSYNLGGPVD